jgi:hypothetical protein
MAHTWTDSGLSALLGAFPRSAAIPAVMYAGLFASQTSGTVPNRTAHGGAAPGGWVETPQFASARQVISGAQWSVPIISGNGVAVTGLQLTFPTATANGLSANGFFLSNEPSSKAGDTPFFFANFDDLTQITINSGDVVRVTPRIQFNVSAGG